MSRRKKSPLRPLTDEERVTLARLGRSQSAPEAEVTRARLVLAVADGFDYQQAAASVGRKSGDAVSALVGRFNADFHGAIKPHTRRSGEGELDGIVSRCKVRP